MSEIEPGRGIVFYSNDIYDRLAAIELEIIAISAQSQGEISYVPPTFERLDTQLKIIDLVGLEKRMRSIRYGDSNAGCVVILDDEVDSLLKLVLSSFGGKDISDCAKKSKVFPKLMEYVDLRQ